MASWQHSVLMALFNLNKEASLSEIYAEVRRIRKLAGDTLPDHTDAIIRARIEERSSDSSIYDRQYDWFQKIGKGVWQLRQGIRTKLDFERWLSQSEQGLSQSARHYVSGICTISHDLKVTNSDMTDLFEVRDTHLLSSLKSGYFSTPEGKNRDVQGHNMFSRAFDLYIQFSARNDYAAAGVHEIFSLEEKQQIDALDRKMIEGELVERKILAYKRNQANVLSCKMRDNYACVSCCFSYGVHIVEAHHLTPLHQTKLTAVGPDDLVTLCPTCHRLAHELLKDDYTLTQRNPLILKIKEVRGLHA